MIEDEVLNRSDFIESFCKILTKWVTSEKDVIFFSATKNKRKNTCGDISPIQASVNWMNKIHFTIKYGYKNASFDKHFLPADNNVIYNLWKNAVDKAYIEKLPLLIYKKPYVATYIFITYDLYKQVSRDLISANMIRMRYSDIPDAYVFEVNDFFNNIKYKKLKKIVSQL